VTTNVSQDTYTANGTISAGTQVTWSYINEKRVNGVAYKVNLTAGTAYLLRVESDINGFLFVTSNGRVVAPWKDSIGGYARTIYTPETSGDYYIIVSSYGDGDDVAYTSGSYTLAIGPAPAGGISGRVTAADTSQPIAYDVDIELYKLNPVNGEYDYIEWTDTDANGQYEFRYLESGTYKAIFYPYNNSLGLLTGEVQPIIVNDGSIERDINIALQPSGRISGRVTLPNGMSQNDVDIMVVLYDAYATDEIDWIRGAYTDENGYYVLGGLNIYTGNYKVGFRIEIYDYSTDSYLPIYKKFYNNKDTLAAADTVSEIQGQTTQNLNATLTASESINATVAFDPNGGSVSESGRTVNVGAAIGALPIPALSGYTFKGWFTAPSGGMQISAATIVTANVTYYAQWEPLASSAVPPAANPTVQPAAKPAPTPVTKISTPLKTVYLKKGASLTIPVVAYSSDGKTAGLTWTSGNNSVATVNQSGKVTAKKKGTAKITAKAENGKSVTVTVNVVNKAKKLKKLTIAGAPKSLKKGKTAQLTVKLTPANATNLSITFKSSKPSVLSVDKAGKLTAQKKGTATITVKAGGKTAKKTITVK
jgi:uncharacterized repeat protein (TIGR02543 family)